MSSVSIPSLLCNFTKLSCAHKIYALHGIMDHCTTPLLLDYALRTMGIFRKLIRVDGFHVQSLVERDVSPLYWRFRASLSFAALHSIFIAIAASDASMVTSKVLDHIETFLERVFDLCPWSAELQVLDYRIERLNPLD